MKNKDLLIGKILDFFMTLEIRRSNLFKAIFRGSKEYLRKPSAFLIGTSKNNR